ncbi:MAG TPA: PQQ-dependent sugar dehydrogenase [Thermoplasmata archaeon]|nr:PQQ-dependent sugar dehydrogenase [Thermoplasmata archaeon]
MDARRALAITLVAVVLGAAAAAMPWPEASGAAIRETVASALAFPVSFAFPPAGEFPAGSILYAERLTGDLRVLTPGGPSPGPVVANVSVLTNGEQGLLGIAVAPDFGTMPYAYAYHTYRNGTTGGAMNRVIRWWLGPTAPPGPAPVDVVLDGIPAGSNHNGGILGFAPDGTLFATTGDAGNSANSQDNGTLAGKVLRMNPDGSIPANNPIPGSPVYTLGHRNVFGLAFHPITGTPYVSENGPSQDDEVNVLEPGRNYGWPVGTGPLLDPRFVDPILTFPAVIAPTGLAFSTGTRSPAWRDSLFLGDWNRGVLQRIALGGPTYRVVTGTEVVDTFGGNGLLDVEDGPDGYLYVSTADAIYRLRDAGGTPGGASVGFGEVLLGIAIAVIVVAFVGALWRERRRRPPAEPPSPPPS